MLKNSRFSKCSLLLINIPWVILFGRKSTWEKFIFLLIYTITYSILELISLPVYGMDRYGMGGFHG